VVPKVLLEARELVDPREHLERLVLPAILVRMEHLELLVSLELVGLQGRPEQAGHREPLVFLDLREALEHRVPRVLQVFLVV